MCREFFAYQISVQKPHLIVCLDHKPRRFVAPISFCKRHIWATAISFGGTL